VTERERMPSPLRERVLAELEPVAPLAPPARRAFAVALPVLAVVGAVCLLVARRRAGDELLTFAGSGFSLVEWSAGLGLIWLALREAVPGLGFGAARAALAIAGAIGLELLLGLALASSGGGAGGPLAAGARCGAVEGALGLPILAVAAFLALRALPLRPRWSGALAGAAAGLFADAIWHLSCAVTDLAHLLVWHLGATVALALMGFLAGSLWTLRDEGRATEESRPASR